MSLHVELDENDRKFARALGEFWEDVKKKFLGVAVAVFVGFCMGKIYTWDTIITDCKVLGTFRIANTAFYCKMMVP